MNRLIEFIEKITLALIAKFTLPVILLTLLVLGVLNIAEIGQFVSSLNMISK